MIKRTLYFGNPAYLSLRNGQLVIRFLKQEERDRQLPEVYDPSVHTIPIEDLGVLVLDNKQITVTQALLASLLENKCALITCDQSHLPLGLMLPLEGNTIQTERMRNQIEVSLPLMKQLWQQTVSAKIRNQAAVLEKLRGVEVNNMRVWAGEVRSGDADNKEARAAVYFWSNAFPELPGFVRAREGPPPNSLLNYGYGILRAVAARALVSSGLHPSFGLHHKNKYNAYCLADDLMEPYRPFVDKLVIERVKKGLEYSQLTKEVKAALLTVPVLEVMCNGKKSPLMVAMGLTASSLQKCYAGETRRLLYPEVG